MRELQAAIKLLQEAPDIGKPCRHRRIAGLRRLLLPTSKYHVYYVHEAAFSVVYVVAIWGAARRRKPPISASS